jgi:carboxylesterase
MSTPNRSYKFSGGPTGVLLVHGLGGTPIEMRYVALALSRAGHTVSVPQLAGHCATEAELKFSHWQDWYATIEAELDEMRKTCDTVIVGGLSAGSVLSLHLAANRPDDVQGVVCMAPTVWLNGWGVPWYATLFRLVRHKWFANLIQFTECEPFGIKDKRMREMVIESLHSGDSSQAGVYSTPGGPMLEFRWLVDIVRRQLKSIKQPTLILHPREDDRADLSNAFYLQRNLGGTVDVTVLDDCYHIITIDRQRDVVAERTVAFTERVVAKIAKSKPAVKTPVPAEADVTRRTAAA